MWRPALGEDRETREETEGKRSTQRNIEGIELDMENWTQRNEYTHIHEKKEFGFKRTGKREKKLPHELSAAIGFCSLSSRVFYFFFF